MCGAQCIVGDPSLPYGICPSWNWTCGHPACYTTANQMCNNAGTCNRTSGICTCDASWYGPGCQVFCAAGITCINGTCGTQGCACSADYYGPRCDVYCTEAACSYHGVCLVSGACYCHWSWGGPDCSSRYTLTITLGAIFAALLAAAALAIILYRRHKQASRYIPIDD
jgi:hypothetical protein